VPSDCLDRRQFLLGSLLTVAAYSGSGPRVLASDHSPLSPAEDVLLEDLERRAYQYFWDHADPRTGQVLDRARADGSVHPQQDIASIAATGFGLAALAVGASRGWLTQHDAAARVRATLEFAAADLPHHHGWFYHFVNRRSGAREWRCEVSPIDTALFMAGVLTGRQAFQHDDRIVRAARTLYERIDFNWMLNGHPHLLAMGWKDETGFLDARWDHYCELMVLYLLGIGSPRQNLPAASWTAWSRPLMTYGPYRYISHADPLFVHQFSHAFVDFRGLQERETGVRWFENSIDATKAHKAFCLDLSKEFPGYRDDVWGISASDSEHGYVAWGGPPRLPGIDGSVVPCAAAGSLMFAPELGLPVVRALRERFGDRVYGRYGFVDAFNPTSAWTNPDVLGINLGITLLSAENLRSGRVWQWFMANPEIRRALNLVGMVPAISRG